MLAEIKVALVRGGLSQVELARRIQATPARLSRIIHGHVAPRVRERVKIARALQLPLWSLFPDSGRARLHARKTQKVRRPSAKR